MNSDEFARWWVRPWSNRDVDAIVACFADNARFVSPRAAEVTGNPVVVGRQALRDYWQRAVASIKSIAFRTAPVFGKIMAMTEPKLAVAYHFQNDPETLPEVVTAVRQVYEGPVDFAVDGMTWNITKDGVRTRVAMLNSQPYPPPSVTERQQAAPGGEKYETPEWILKGFAWEAMPTMDEVFKVFNEQFGTNFEFQLKAMVPPTEASPQ